MVPLTMLRRCGFFSGRAHLSQRQQRWFCGTVHGTVNKADLPSNLHLDEPDFLLASPSLPDYRHRTGRSLALDVVKLSDPTAVVDKVELSREVFCTPVRPDILHRVVRWQRAKRQQGTHKIKTISERSGSGRKPLPQKGTGRARQGSRRAPHHRKGGRVFGPVVRSHAHKLNRKVRNFGLRSALAAKWLEGNVVVLDSLELETPKTKLLADHIAAHSWGRALVVDGETVNAGFLMASRNLKRIHAIPQIGCNVMDVLRNEKLIITLPGLEALQERLVRGMRRTSINVSEEKPS